jgi:hypothetical protein
MSFLSFNTSKAFYQVGYKPLLPTTIQTGSLGIEYEQLDVNYGLLSC